MAEPGYLRAADAAGRGHLRASHADREQVIDSLKAAFVQGRLTKDEFDARIGQALGSRTYAELATVTADIPDGLAGARTPAKPPRRLSSAAKWGISGFITPAILAAAFVFGSLGADGKYGAVAAVIAFGYFLFWLSVGADMLWEWHCTSLPSARVCVRCGHTAAAHRAPASCTIRLSAVKSTRCPCTGYVPPGVSPQTADLQITSG
jgi:Domain of unknown function (DUF1707)